MSKNLGCEGNGERFLGVGVRENDAGGGIEGLKQRFLRFRGEHRKRTRIPDRLREEALATIERGMSADEVRRACGISPGQLNRWIECRGAFRQSLGEEEEEASRVYPVVDGDLGIGDLQAGECATAGLQLRVGGWDICIRQDNKR